MPMLSIADEAPLGGGMLPPPIDGEGISIGGVAVVGIRISVDLRSGGAGAVGVMEDGAVWTAEEGGGINEEPLVFKAPVGALGGAKLLLLRWRGALGGGGRNGLLSMLVCGSATIMVGM